MSAAVSNVQRYFLMADIFRNEYSLANSMMFLRTMRMIRIIIGQVWRSATRAPNTAGS
jgi:hypothetical protein